MRRYLLIIAFAISINARAQNPGGFIHYAELTDVTPDTIWRDQNNRDWWTGGYGTAAGSFNGVVYVFNYQGNGIRQGAHAYIYYVNKKHNDDQHLVDCKLGPSHINRIDFNYHGESTSYDPGWILGRTFTFMFNGRLWYFEHIHDNYIPDHQTNPTNQSFECFAQVPTDTTQSCFVYYDTYYPPPEIYKMGAFQLDSNLYFLGLNQNSSSSNYNKWAIEEYNYNPTTNKFSHSNNADYYITSIQGKLFGGVIKKIDSLGREYLICNTYDYGSSSYMFKLKHKQGAQFTFTDVSVVAFTDNGASVIVEGSLKGKKTRDLYPTKPDRFIRFSIASTVRSDGTYGIDYEEWLIDNDSVWFGRYNVEDTVDGGTVITPSTYSPQKAGSCVRAVASFELVPTDFTTSMQGIDGYKQYLWFIYAGSSSHSYGVKFESDKWRIDPAEIVESADLDNTAQYDNVKDLWSLVGIIDGPPPVSVDWETWALKHPPLTPASELSFKATARKNIEMTNSTEDKWSIGESVNVTKNVDKVLSGSLSEEFKYSKIYKTTQTSGTTYTTSVETPFELFETGQEYGYYIWTVPQIKRFTYALYPWWDKNLEYRVESSVQYLFRTMGVVNVNEALPLAGYPFYVSEPNGASMAGWKADLRYNLNHNIITYDLSPCLQLDWTNLSTGSTNYLSVAVDSTTSEEVTNSMEIHGQVGMEAKVPEVFRMEVETGGSWEGTYTAETSIKTEFEHEIKGSLGNLNAKVDGLNISSLHMKAYWFRPETNPDWWFYDSLGDFRPWYIAWLVTSSTEKLLLQSPGDGAVLGEPDLLFSWQAEGGELHDYTFYIYGASDKASSNILLKTSLDYRTNYNLSDFKPEKRATYFWAVRAFNSSGEAVWSPKWKFTIKAEDQDEAMHVLKAVLYPNPARNDDIHLIVDPEVAGKISVQLFNVNGTIMADKEISSADGLPVTLTLSGPALPSGVYYAMIRAGDKKVVKKVVIR